MPTGCLFIVATPIGNPGDITLRALDTLRSVDAVLCEEMREGSRLLKQLGISGKELLPVNEHNEAVQVPLVVERLLHGQSLALISDCGTPVFADPGYRLIEQAAAAGITILPIPGASSLMATLSMLTVKLDQFVYAGFLPREKEARRIELQRLRSIGLPVIFMDTPYRLHTLLEEVERVFGANQAATLACDLTLPAEKIFRGKLSQIRGQPLPAKAEFILVTHS